MRIFYKKLFVVLLLLVFIYIPSIAYSQNDLLSFSKQGINFSISQDNNNVVLKVANPNIANINKFALSSPSRIVIDMQGVKIGRSESIGINNVPLIDSIRLGAHPPYTTRMVLDIKNGASLPSYTTFLNKGELSVILANPNGTPVITNSYDNINTTTQNTNTMQAPSLNEPSIVKINRMPQATSQAANVGVNVPKQVVPTIATPSVPSVSPTVQPTLPVATETKALQDLKESTPSKENFANSSSCVLTAVYFDNDVTSSPIVKVSLNKKSDFKIVKFSSEQYKITIPNCKLATKNLELPFFPPPEFKNFVFIQAKDISNGVEVSIGVEENTSLVNLQRDNEIWVKPQN